MVRRLIALILLALPAHAQGIPVGELQCQTTYAGQTFKGVIQFQILQLGADPGLGKNGPAGQVIMLIRRGKANEIPGTLMMNGHFRGLTAFADFEATMGGNQGTGAVWLNGANHRATYADFYIVEGGVIMLTEDNQRVDYLCP